MNHRRREKLSLRLVSVSMPAPELSVGAFLRMGIGDARMAWLDSRCDLSVAGSGAAVELKGWGEQRFREIEYQARDLFRDAWIDEDAPEEVRPRLFGGFAFRDDFLPDNTWSVFYPAQFILPHWQFTRVDGDAWLSIHVLLPLVADRRQEIEQLREALNLRYHWMVQHSSKTKNAGCACNGAVDVRYPLSMSAWEKMVGSAVEEIRQGSFQKVVLARMCEVRCRSSIYVDMALAVLDQNYADCYRFLFEPQPQHVFFGATPELLVSVQGFEICSMALAGSIRRGKTLVEDARLEMELLHSQKDRLEHGLVAAELHRRLADDCETLEIADQPGILKLQNIQHLYTPVQGRLRRAGGVIPWVERLHPTPALGGMPREAAMAFIRQAEPVTRGWYAAPVGWIDDRLDGAFGVAIRSAVTQNERAWLYAGAGIVGESQAQQEWAETELKFRPALQALGIEAEALAVG